MEAEPIKPLDQIVKNLIAKAITPPEKDGLFYDIPSEVYHAWPLEVCSNSALSDLGGGCPEELEYIKNNPAERTPALILGDAMHFIILQPDLFDKHYTVAPNCESIKKDGERCDHPGKHMAEDGRWCCGQHKGKKKLLDIPGTVISAEDHQHCIKIRDRLYADERATSFLTDKNRRVEVTGLCHDAEHGFRCKMRNDILILQDKIICDLKSTIDVKKFDKSLFDFGYHRQGAFYLDFHTELARHGLSEPCDAFSFIAFNKTPPYSFRVLALDEDSIAWGRVELEATRRMFDRCIKAKTWPGYGFDWKLNNYLIEKTSIPDYAKGIIAKRMETESQ